MVVSLIQLSNWKLFLSPWYTLATTVHNSIKALFAFHKYSTNIPQIFHVIGIDLIMIPEILNILCITWDLICTMNPQNITHTIFYTQCLSGHYQWFKCSQFPQQCSLQKVSHFSGHWTIIVFHVLFICRCTNGPGTGKFFIFFFVFRRHNNYIK